MCALGMRGCMYNGATVCVGKQLFLQLGDHCCILWFFQSNCTLWRVHHGKPRIKSCFPTGATSRVICSSCPCWVMRVTVACSLTIKNVLPVTVCNPSFLCRGLVGFCFFSMNQGWLKFPLP